MIGVTTIDQSRRLIQAGLDTNTADLCWRALAFERKDKDESWWPQKGTPIKLIADGSKAELDVPAWSMGALWKILYESNIYFYEYDTGNSVEYVMESLVCGVVQNQYNDVTKHIYERSNLHRPPCSPKYL